MICRFLIEKAGLIGRPHQTFVVSSLFACGYPLLSQLDPSL